MVIYVYRKQRPNNRDYRLHFTFILSTEYMPIIIPGESKAPIDEIREERRKKGFLLPNVPNASNYCKTNFGAEYDDSHQLLKFCKGTTTLAFKYQGGVIVSVDSRATQGQFIGMKCIVTFISSFQPSTQSHSCKPLSSWYYGRRCF